ncbi:MAG: hypothetical protein ACK58M_22025 [Acidobacteriota bacterium]|jgi:hypothetical protein
MSTWNPFNSSTEPETSRNPRPLAHPTATASPLPQPGPPKLCPNPDLPPSAWVAAHLGFIPDPAQARFLDAPQKRLAFVGSRQSGKSQTAAAKALYLALRHPGTDYLLFGRVARQLGLPAPVKPPYCTPRHPPAACRGREPQPTAT